MYYLLLPSEKSRDGFIAHLRENSVLAVFHYLPLNLSEMGRRFGGIPRQCPVAEDIAGRLVRLPFYTSMSDTDQEFVIDSVRAFRG
jgi:dTDP-4-amino-4,6-dideoxygalactose transaminase